MNKNQMVSDILCFSPNCPNRATQKMRVALKNVPLFIGNGILGALGQVGQLKKYTTNIYTHVRKIYKLTCPNCPNMPLLIGNALYYNYMTLKPALNDHLSCPEYLQTCPNCPENS